jgi:hypothetical protein
MTTIRWPGRPGRAAERLRRAALVVLAAGLLAAPAACGDDDKGPSTTTSLPPTTASSTTTSTAPLAKEALVLSADGLGPALKFHTENAARTINLLRQALGEPERNQPLPVGTTCGATRRLQWANLQVLVNEVGGSSGAGKPGFAGWYLGAPAATTVDLKTEKGITIGSTVAALKAAYGTDVNVSRGEAGPSFSITVPTGIILGQLDALTDAGKVKNIQAGNYCGAA